MNLHGDHLCWEVALVILLWARPWVFRAQKRVQLKVLSVIPKRPGGSAVAKMVEGPAHCQVTPQDSYSLQSLAKSCP